MGFRQFGGPRNNVGRASVQSKGEGKVNSYYTLAIVESRFSRHVTRVLDADMDKLAELFKTSIEVDSKDGVPLFSPWKYTSRERNGDAVEGTNLLVLDYDNGPPVDFIAGFFAGRYHSFIYTTFSHSKDRPSFRVVLPTRDFVGKDEIKAQRRNILAHFPPNGQDSTSMDVARCFYVPCHRKGTIPIHYRTLGAYFHPNDYFKYDWKEDKLLQRTSEITDKERAAALFCLCRCKSLSERGSEPLWFNIACAMASNGFNREEFVRVSESTWPGQERRYICQKWDKALHHASIAHTSFGVIVNLIKRDMQYAWYLKARDMVLD